MPSDSEPSPMVSNYLKALRCVLVIIQQQRFSDSVLGGNRMHTHTRYDGFIACFLVVHVPKMAPFVRPVFMPVI